MEIKNSATPYVAGALAVALIAGVSAWVMRSRAAAAPERVTADPAPPAQAFERAATTAAGTSLAPAAPFAGPDLASTMAGNEASVSKLIDAGERKLLTRYESERVDPAWASSKQQALERLSVSPQIEQLNAQPLAIEARCRASVCLIDADFPSRLAADDWYTLYTLNAGAEMFTSSVRTTSNPDGSVHLRIYGLARQ